MSRYILRRMLWAFITLLLVSAVVFAVFFLLPAADPARLAARRVPRLGRSRSCDISSAPIDHGSFSTASSSDAYSSVTSTAGRVLASHFQNFVPVRTELIERLPVTISLAAGATLIWLLMGIPIGIISATRQGSLVDRVAMLFALVGVSMYVVWLSLLLLYFFWFKLHLVCGPGYVPFSVSPASWGCHLVLPWFALALGYAAWYARMTRGNLIEVMHQDYIRTARAKGLTERRIILRHGLRSALTPIVTLFGLDLALLLGGAVVVETIFNLPGIGLYAYQAVRAADIPAIAGVTLLGTFFIVSANVIVDILYAFLDPRVRYG